MAKWKSPYPALGTPAGEEVIGVCRAPGCAANIRRGTRFSTRLGDILVCQDCNEAGKDPRKEAPMT